MRFFLFAVVTAALAAGCGMVLGDSGRNGDAGDAGIESSTPTHESGAPTDGGPSVDANPCPDMNAIWAQMDTQPILPFKSAALLTLSGKHDAFVSLSEAESILCKGHDLGDVVGDGTRVQGWGSANEVELDYQPTTGAGNFVRLGPGYTGSLDFYSDPASKIDPPGSGATPCIPGTGTSTRRCLSANHYRVMTGQQIQKNGLPFEIDWSDLTQASNQMRLFNALSYWLGTPIGLYVGGDYSDACTDGWGCFVTPTGSGLSFEIPEVSLTFIFPDTTSQPAASTVGGIDLLPSPRRFPCGGVIPPLSRPQQCSDEEYCQLRIGDAGGPPEWPMWCFRSPTACDAQRSCACLEATVGALPVSQGGCGGETMSCSVRKDSPPNWPELTLQCGAP
jgi:hypothetical protein